MQTQLIDAIRFITERELLKNWPQLIDSLCEKMCSGNLGDIFVSLRIIHAISKRYRKLRTHVLLNELKLTIRKFANPLTISLSQMICQKDMHSLQQSLILITKIFKLWNARYISEFFEINMNIWLHAFHKLLTIQFSGPEQLYSKIYGNLIVCVQKYNKQFQTHLDVFVADAWHSLARAIDDKKYNSVSKILYIVEFLHECTDYRVYRL